MPNFERIPPHNQDAEMSVLGSILLDQETYFQVAEIVKPADFYSQAHQEIFSAMQQLREKGEPIDTITVSEALSRRHSLEAAGGRAYIAELSTVAPTAANAREYASIVAEKAVFRRLISTSSGIVENCYKEELEAGQVLDEAERQIFDIAKTRQSGVFSSLSDVWKEDIKAIDAAQKNGGIIQGLATGYADLDRITNGLQKSDLIIIAARPSMGKTAFALNIAQNAAKNNKKVAIFSLEMSKESLGMRLLAMEARVDSYKLRSGQLTDDDWESINFATEEMANAPLNIDDTPGISVMEIRNKCRRMAQTQGLDLIVIDYLQLMSSPGKVESRQQEVSAISRLLKQLAREMDCPVIVLSQLSRNVEQRGGSKKPMLSDLRESGAIEQDADIVMFLYRDDYYKEKTADGNNQSNTCEIIIAKQRNGATGSVFLTWQPRFTKFVNMQRREEDINV